MPSSSSVCLLEEIPNRTTRVLPKSGQILWRKPVDAKFVFYQLRVMKKVTVTLSEDVAAWLKIRAAEDGHSVSGWLAELLEGIRSGEDEYDIAMQRYLARKPRKLCWIDGRKPRRDELHDRSGLR